MSTSNVINRVTESRNVIWDVNTQAWIAMQQPILNAGSVTIPGTVTVSGAVSVSNLPATQPVSGTVAVSNFPATQPVSLAVAPTTPVTGTFWQTTQPVSLASAPTTPVTNSGLTNLDVALSTRLKPADTLAGITTVGTVSTITNVVHIDDNSGSITVDSPNLDVALSTRLKPADTLTGVTTVGTITNPVTVAQPTGTNLHVVVDTAPTTAVTIAAMPSTPVTGAFYQTTQSVSMASGSNIDLASLLLYERQSQSEALTSILTELRVLNTLISEGVRTIDSGISGKPKLEDLSILRSDELYSLTIQ